MDYALVDFQLKELIKDGVFSIKNLDLNKYVEPASIDLPVGKVAYLVKQKFLPFSNNVQSIVNKLNLEEINLENGNILFKGQTYLIPIMDVNLPNNLHIKISPKSSIGRVDLMVRSVFDNIGLYDTIINGSKGKLWLEVSPQSFNIKLKTGIALSQLRVFEKGDDDYNFNNDKFVYNRSDNNKKDKDRNIKNKNGNKIKFYEKNKFFLSLNVSENPIFGYEAKNSNEIIDLTKNSFYNWQDFFKKIDLTENKFTIEKDKFYILATKELISVPKNYSIEMLPFTNLVGELRVHYAGFFDPGFGGEFGKTGVLEIRPHETLTIYDGQPICLMEIFRNKAIPNKLYGENSNNYHMQDGPKLAKYFK